MTATSIEWTEHSINPFRARLGNGDGHYCEKLSPGCKRCYSSRTQPRFRMPQFQEQRGAGVEHYLDARKLQQVLDRKKPTKFFWCDMTDMFGAWVPNEWIAACFGVMAATPQHTHQVLTKRADRLPETFAWVSREAKAFAGTERASAEAEFCAHRLWLNGEIALGGPVSQPWPLPNVHLGVSAEDQQRANERIPHLLACPAAVRWVSAEPLLGPIDFEEFVWPTCIATREEHVREHDGGLWCDERSIDWIVVGGESGPGARECSIEWLRSIVAQCKSASVPIFVKQLGATIRVPESEQIGDVTTGWSPFARICESDDWLIRLQSSKGGDINEWPHDLRVREFPEARA